MGELQVWHEQRHQQYHCQPALPQKLLMVLVSWGQSTQRVAGAQGMLKGGWAERNLLLVASQQELQLFKALMFAICKARCSGSRVLSSPGGAGAVPGRLWPAQLCGLLGAGLSRALKLSVLPD